MFQFQIDEEIESSDSVDTSHSHSSITNSSEPSFTLGEVVKSDGFCGTVKYIGPVSPHTGIWLGVEWENPTRGKHSGSVGGIQYFESIKQGAASFIRPHKVRKINNLASAILKRYEHNEDYLNSLKKVDEKTGPKRIVLSKLKALDVCGFEISDLGDANILAETCPMIQSLNLAQNLIEDLNEVAKICKPLHKLVEIDLSGNPLKVPEVDNLASSLDSFRNLETVILASVNFNWTLVLNSALLWPQIIKLHVPLNKISSLQPPLNALLNLKTIDLMGNQISSWDEVIKLDSCKNLESINLCENKIKSVRFPIDVSNNNSIDSQSTKFFANLHRLNLSENLIDDWISVNELNKLKKLSELRIELNRFLEYDTKDTNRQMIIARMSKLVKLEGVDIDRVERRDAELDYVKKFAHKWTNEGSELKFAQENPRYAELIKKLGESEEGENDKVVKTMNSTLINLICIPEDIKVKQCSKKVMPKMTVQKLKMLLQRAFHIKSPITKLEIISSRNSGITFSLENDFYELSQYSVEDGDKVIVSW